MSRSKHIFLMDLTFCEKSVCVSCRGSRDLSQVVVDSCCTMMRMDERRSWRAHEDAASVNFVYFVKEGSSEWKLPTGRD